MDNTYDVIVVGGGAAGMSGAKIIARMRRRVLVVDAGAPRNAPAEGVHNYLYAEGAAPGDLAALGRAEAVAYGVDVVTGSAVGAEVLADAEPGASRFSVDVRTADGATTTVGARRVLLATGLVDVLPDVDGLVERWGIDVLHCPFCHGWEVRGQAVGVLGTGPMSVHQVLLFRQLSEDVTYFQHTAPDPSEEQVEQLASLGVELIVGEVAGVETTDGALSGVRMADGNVVPRQALGVGTFLAGREDLVADLGLEMAEMEMGGAVLGRYLPADPAGLTATPGVWAAGNVAAPIAQVISSAAAGAGAGSAMHVDMVTEDVAIAVAAHREDTDRCGSGAMSAGTALSTAYWNHREARWVEELTSPPSGRDGPAARAFAERAAAARDAEAFWEPHYTAMSLSTDGPLPAPNVALVDVTAGAAPGSALDLGCGQGGDALWLAARGWAVTTVDVSATALERVAERAEQAGLSHQVHVDRHDLSATFPQGSFDLVSAQYLHSPVAMDRAAILRRAAGAVAPGGMLLVVDHASVSPWSWADPGTVFPAPRQTLDGFGLDLSGWRVVAVEDRDREADGPGGQRATVTDTVIALVRRGAVGA